MAISSGFCEFIKWRAEDGMILPVLLSARGELG
jgi:hypothetical protein